jgi:hypothetical protein
MLIFGHPWVPSPKFKKAFSRDDIDKVSDGEIVLLEPLTESIPLAQYCQSRQIEYAVTVNEMRNAIFANALEAAYIVCQQEDAIEFQPIAERYLFDAKILVLIEDEKAIERLARFSIDGVIFPAAIGQAS